MSDRSERLKALFAELNRAIEAEDYSRINEIVSPDLVHHRRGLETTLPLLLGTGPRPASAAEAFQRATALINARFDGWHAEIDAIYCDGDTVVARQTMSGRFRGTFPGSAVEDPHFSFPMIVIPVFDANDRIVSMWALGDELGFFRQLGVTLPDSAR